jgi:hypothetical protein
MRPCCPHCQQVLHEVAQASDGEEEEGQEERAGRQLAGGPASAPPPGSQSPLPPDQEAKRRQVLARLAADDGPDPPHSQRQPRGEAGRGEEQAQPLAGSPHTFAADGRAGAAAAAGAGAAPVAASQALTSLWGWGKGLASKVEQAAASVGRELAETVHDAQPAVAAVKR